MLVCSIGFASATEWTSTYSGNWEKWKSVLGNISSSGVFTGITSNTQAFTAWKDTSNGLEAIWKIDIGTTSTSYEVSKSYIRFGTSKKPITKLEFSTSSFSGKTISAVKVISAFCTGTSSVSVTVGGTKFTCNGNETGTPGTSSSAGEDLTFTGSGSGDIVISYTVENKKQVGLNGLSVTYTEGGGEVKTLGDINVTYGDDNTVVANDDIIDNIPEGTVFNFSAANATSITVTDTDNNGGTIASGTDKASWTATETSADEITVTATDGTETKTFTFTVGVVKVIPQLGDITASYGSVQDKALTEEEVLSVYANTTITFAAANATSISYSSVMQDPKSATGNQITYVATAEDVITITALGEDNQKKEVTISVVIAAEPEKEVWTLVTDANQLSANATYIIAATNGSSSYGLATIAKSTRMDYVETTVTDDVIIDPESDLMRLKLEIDNSGTTPKYYWKTLNYAGGEQGYVSGSGPDDKNKYNTDLKVLEANTYALTTVAVSNKNATITFTNNNSRVLAINLPSNNNYSFGCYASSNLGTSSYHYPRIYTNAGATRPVWRTTANGDIEILSTKGELHLMVFDEDGNQINNDGSKARALATDATWTNKVKEAGEIHTIYKPAAGEGKILIQAKEVYNGIHSKEVKFSLASDGTTTGITAVEAEDADAPVEYYNMQGVRVMNPAQGLYIRRQGNRVEKVALR